MSVTNYGRPADFRIGRVFGDTFGVILRNFWLCIGLAVIFTGIPELIYDLLVGAQAQPEPAETAAAFDTMSVARDLTFFLIYVVLYSIVQAALVRATIEDLNGQQPTFADALSRGIALLPKVIGLAFVTYICIFLGFAALVIPGIYILVRWSAALPALVQERLGVMASLERSSELTKGSRWRILALYVILIVAALAVGAALELVNAAISALAGAAVAVVISAAISSISTAIASIATAVIYVELRYVMEGTDVKELAEIFA